MLKLLWLFVVQPQFVDCGCLCVEGMPKTVCQSIEEAQRQTNLCPLDLRCPSPPQADGDAPMRFDAPGEHARNCREVRVWDEAAGGYTGVRVCDVFTG